MTSIEPTTERYDTARAVLLAAVAALGGFLFGFDTAVINGAVLAIRETFGMGAGLTGFVVLRRRRVPISPLVAAIAAVTITAATTYGIIRFRVPGDVVFVTLPKPGERFDAHQTFGTIEAVKAVSELFNPLAGQVVEVNGALEKDPAAVNRDPYGEGWMVTLKLDDPSAKSTLLSPAAYRAHIGE